MKQLSLQLPYVNIKPWQSEAYQNIKPIRLRTFEKAMMGKSLTKAERMEIEACTESLRAYENYLNRRVESNHAQAKPA